MKSIQPPSLGPSGCPRCSSRLPAAPSRQRWSWRLRAVSAQWNRMDRRASRRFLPRTRYTRARTVDNCAPDHRYMRCVPDREQPRRPGRGDANVRSERSRAHRRRRNRRRHRRRTELIVKLIVNDKGNPVGKLADAALHFTSGPLEGLTDRLRGLGAQGSHVPGLPVLGERRAHKLRASASCQRLGRSEPHPRNHAATLCRARGGSDGQRQGVDGAMLNRVIPGEPCSYCYLRFGSHELVKTDGGKWFHESTFKRCWRKWKLRQEQQNADVRKSA